MLDYTSIAAICRAAEEKQMTISALTLSDQAVQLEVPEEELYERMKKNLHIMQEAVRQGKNPALRSTSGLTGGDAAKVEAYAATGGITGIFLNRAMARAVAVSEYNAAMGKIVAAPTAGSCGILPGTVVSMLEEDQVEAYPDVIYAAHSLEEFERMCVRAIQEPPGWASQRRREHGENAAWSQRSAQVSRILNTAGLLSKK